MNRRWCWASRSATTESRSLVSMSSHGEIRSSDRSNVGGGEVVEVDVPPGQGGDEPLVGSRQRARERQDASVAVAAQLPPEPAVDVAEVLDHAQRLELGDRAVQDGAVALVVGVEPAQ